MEKKPPLLILTGPTAVGKTALSIALAREVQGEIISADSMQVYRYMDIGSAKIRKEEMVREKKNEAFYETYSEYAAKVHLAKDDSLWKNLSITDGEKTSADFFEIFETVCKETE